MNTPDRLLNQGEPGAELLQTARDYQPTTEGRDRLLGALEVGGVAAVAALTTKAGVAAAAGAGSGAAAGGGAVSGSGTAAAAAAGATGTIGGATSGTVKGATLLGSASKLLAMKPLLLVVGMGAAAAATVVGVTGGPDGEVEGVALSGQQGEADHARETEGLPSQQAAPADEPADADVEPPALPSSEQGPSAEPRVPAKPPQIDTGDKADAPASLVDELQKLKQARIAMKSGDAQTALALLADHARRYPSSSLGLEREVLTIEALHASGQREKAQARARSFVRRHPSSMLSERLRSIAGTAGAPQQRPTEQQRRIDQQRPIDQQRRIEQSDTPK